MSPTKPVNVNRGQLALFALLLLSAVALALVLNNRRTSDISRLTKENRALINNFARFRVQRARETAASDVRLCKAINETRLINNRDRLTIIRSLRNSEAALKTTLEPTLRGLLVQSIASTRHEIDVRPFLKPLKCGQLPSANGHGKSQPGSGP